jgi:DNA uptake protein ComE-like DNA-binding protein
MNFDKLKSYFLFSKEQRIGILFLFAIIISLQLAYHFINFKDSTSKSNNYKEWLSFQKEIDSLKQVKQDYVPKIYPFNPNFITDYKGYKLGMSVKEIDKLLAFRKTNKYVNSAQEFQNVTGVSDSLLKVISPYFKFPDWVTNKNPNGGFNKNPNWIDYSKINNEKKATTVILDINTATKEDLMKVYGIGDAISDRILKQKELFGEFVSMDQMEDVWGLTPEVIEKLNQKFKVINPPSVKKIKINEASIKELGLFPYFRFPISKNIVIYRSMHGDIKIEDLAKIKDFPVEKTKIIALYLEF